jgi:hypothetical protein
MKEVFGVSMGCLLWMTLVVLLVVGGASSVAVESRHKPLPLGMGYLTPDQCKN